MTQSLPLLSLQNPKDVSIEEIDAELNEIWQNNHAADSGTIATRATTFTMVIYESEEKSDDSAIAETLASSNPGRIIALYPTETEDEGVSAQVSAYCPIQKQGSNSLVCCEYINLTGTPEALERIGGMICALMLGDLPRFLWWKAHPKPKSDLFQRLANHSDTVIIDSSTFDQTEAELQCVGQLLSEGMVFADLNWRRLSAWQELTAEAFDPPERRNALTEVDQVTIDYEQGNPSQALMFLGWLASRLQWEPISYDYEGGDYDIRRVKLQNGEQKEVVAELAGIPTDAGEIPGDLISIRLSSTNLEADCCTVLCSETTGCMRMEAGGGAQSCRIQQVTPLFDQKTEQLLLKQVQRWGREVLYEESMALTHKMLKLKS